MKDRLLWYTQDQVRFYKRKSVLFQVDDVLLNSSLHLPEVLCGTEELSGDGESPWDMFTQEPALLGRRSTSDSNGNFLLMHIFITLTGCHCNCALSISIIFVLIQTQNKKVSRF